MATLQSTKSPPVPPQVSLTSSSGDRPISEFDVGINTSAAWTEHLEQESSYNPDISVSDEEKEETQTGRSGRAIYDFEGKAEFRELTLKAGDELEILKEELSDGWSLVNCHGQVGLIPRTYYIFTSEFTTPPSLHVNTAVHARNASNQSITPRGSPTISTPPPIENQRTGEWGYGLPNFRQSLLGGKSLNRFSSFVTTGAEEWVLNGTAADQVIEGSATAPPNPVAEDEDEEDESDEENSNGKRLSKDADRHFVDSGPAWKPKITQFKVLVHSPSKRSSTLSGSFTSYQVTSLFFPSPPTTSASTSNPPSPTRITVHRRFSHFVFLHTALTRRLPGIALPPLPEKQYAGRFSDEFVEARRGDLERYLGRIVRHPVARYAEVLTFFLGCESEAEWKRRLPQHRAMPPAGPQFYAQVYHPAFNLDLEDASESVERFRRHLRAVGKGVQSLRNIFGQFREAKLAASNAHRLLSYSILSLITSTPLASAPTTGLGEDEGEEDDYREIRKGLMNEQGGWCWRENCPDCLRLTKALQKTAEALQSIADLYDDNARRTHLSTHDALKDVAHPSVIYAPVVETHKATLSRYKSATREAFSADDIAARCETVLNTTMAEFETYHVQKTEDFETLATELLDGEIKFYEQVLARLRTARQNFTGSQYTALGKGSRQPSIYERELSAPRLTAAPLPQPCPHVFDAAPMRPVSVAIQEGVGLLLGNSSGRASVFGRFW